MPQQTRRDVDSTRARTTDVNGRHSKQEVRPRSGSSSYQSEPGSYSGRPNQDGRRPDTRGPQDVKQSEQSQRRGDAAVSSQNFPSLSRGAAPRPAARPVIATPQPAPSTAAWGSPTPPATMAATPPTEATAASPTVSPTVKPAPAPSAWAAAAGMTAAQRLAQQQQQQQQQLARQQRSQQQLQHQQQPPHGQQQARPGAGHARGAPQQAPALQSIGRPAHRNTAHVDAAAAPAAAAPGSGPAAVGPSQQHEDAATQPATSSEAGAGPDASCGLREAAVAQAQQASTSASWPAVGVKVPTDVDAHMRPHRPPASADVPMVHVGSPVAAEVAVVTPPAAARSFAAAAGLANSRAPAQQQQQQSTAWQRPLRSVPATPPAQLPAATAGTPPPSSAGADSAPGAEQAAHPTPAAAATSSTHHQPSSHSSGPPPEPAPLSPTAPTAASPAVPNPSAAPTGVSPTPAGVPTPPPAPLVGGLLFGTFDDLNFDSETESSTQAGTPPLPPSAAAAATPAKVVPAADLPIADVAAPPSPAAQEPAAESREEHVRGAPAAANTPSAAAVASPAPAALSCTASPAAAGNTTSVADVTSPRGPTVGAALLPPVSAQQSGEGGTSSLRSGQSSESGAAGGTVAAGEAHVASQPASPAAPPAPLCWADKVKLGAGQAQSIQPHHHAAPQQRGPPSYSQPGHGHPPRASSVASSSSSSRDHRPSYPSGRSDGGSTDTRFRDPRWQQHAPRGGYHGSQGYGQRSFAPGAGGPPAQVKRRPHKTSFNAHEHPEDFEEPQISQPSQPSQHSSQPSQPTEPAQQRPSGAAGAASTPNDAAAAPAPPEADKSERAQPTAAAPPAVSHAPEASATADTRGPAEAEAASTGAAPEVTPAAEQPAADHLPNGVASEQLGVAHNEPTTSKADTAAAPPALAGAAAAAAADGPSTQAAMEALAYSALRALVGVNTIEELLRAGGGAPGGPLRLQPRGLVNTGNSCFVNCTLQALMASSGFCGLLNALRGAVGLLDPAAAPTLHALALFASEFEAAKPPEAAEVEPSPAEGWASVSAKGGRRGGRPAATLKPVSTHALPPAPLNLSTSMAAVLGGRALVPSMLNDVVYRFNPRRAQQQQHLHAAGATSAAGAGATQPPPRLSMAQKLAQANGGGDGQQEQEDAQEFFNFLVDRAHEELMALIRSQRGELQAAESAASSDGVVDDPEEWSQVGRKNKVHVTRDSGDGGGRSLLSGIFRGSMKSIVKAPSAAPSVTVEPFFLLHLDVAADGINTIDDALEAYFSPETIHGYKTKNTDVAVAAQKYFRLFRLPSILVLHIKRFVYNPVTNGTTKLHKPIAFDTRLRLRASMLADDCADRKTGATYSLIATVNHHGRNSSGGHYTADVLQPDGRWLNFNDAQVNQVPVAQVLAEKAYLLMFQRA